MAVHKHMTNSQIDRIILEHIGWDLAFPKPAAVPDVRQIESEFAKLSRQERETWRPGK